MNTSHFSLDYLAFERSICQRKRFFLYEAAVRGLRINGCTLSSRAPCKLKNVGVRYDPDFSLTQATSYQFWIFQAFL